MKPFSIVVAFDEKNGIGKNGDLAWRLSADLKHFKETTSKVSDPQKRNAVIMGRKTWDSLPEKFKPLPGRFNVVLSQNALLEIPSDVMLSSSLDHALSAVSSMADIENVYVIGGAQVYFQALKSDSCQKLYVTQVKGDFACDAFFPAISSLFKEAISSAWLQEGQLQYRFCLLQRSS